MNTIFPTHFTRFNLHGDRDLQLLKPMKWVVKGVLPESGLAAIYGPPGSGKSFFGLDLGLAIARGKTWFGARVNPAPVVYRHGFRAVRLFLRPKSHHALFEQISK